MWLSVAETASFKMGQAAYFSFVCGVLNQRTFCSDLMPVIAKVGRAPIVPSPSLVREERDI